MLILAEGKNDVKSILKMKREPSPQNADEGGDDAKQGNTLTFDSAGIDFSVSFVFRGKSEGGSLSGSGAALCSHSHAGGALPEER